MVVTDCAPIVISRWDRMDRVGRWRSSCLHRYKAFLWVEGYISSLIQVVIAIYLGEAIHVHTIHPIYTLL